MKIIEGHVTRIEINGYFAPGIPRIWMKGMIEMRAVGLDEKGRPVELLPTLPNAEDRQKVAEFIDWLGGCLKDTEQMLIAQDDLPEAPTDKPETLGDLA